MMGPTPPPAPQDPGRLRLLIVDDNPDVLRDLRLLLELSGSLEVVAEARNGRDAVQLAVSLAPDVVVMDLEMPGMDGYEATRQIKSQPSAPRVIILSVHARPVEIERARAAGADDFVMKGASYGILVKAIRAQNGSPDSRG